MNNTAIEGVNVDTVTVQLAQLAGLIRYEFLLQWRRRGLLIVTIALLVLGIGFVLAAKEQIDTSRAAMGGRRHGWRLTIR